MSQVQEETEIKGGIWMPPEDYAALFKASNPKGALSVYVIKQMLNENSKKTRYKFDRRDVKRFSRNHVFLYYTKPNASGISCPRIVPR